MRLQSERNWLQTCQTFSGVAANRPYRASFWLRGDGGTVTLRVNNGECGSEIIRKDCPVTNVWAQSRVLFNSGGNSALTFILSDSGAAGKTLFNVSSR